METDRIGNSARAEQPLLEIRNLSVSFGRGTTEVNAVRGISMDIHRGESLGVVGESGSGKSVTALSILQLLPYPIARHPGGSIRFFGNPPHGHPRPQGEELLGAVPEKLRRFRGNHIAMIKENSDGTRTPLTMPNHRTIKKSTLRTILTQAKISRNDFLETYYS